ncbi:type VI secretion system lipoprotein TssJ [Dyella monticola]|uniref:Type VI secretion system lipoprotein TssJ n=1 Tax=Dyella monticola TaxID=1927958 RepID=A0A370WXP2_9GAMM|nr:type VI secretion system lipoprotein TssJ [Dyella monticola]RDS80882.1 type VI secretion system lipoprotein TssJ [Dyella monticola]
MSTSFVFRSRCVAFPIVATLLTGCGAWQTVKDTSSHTAQAIFIAKVKQMNLVVEGRAGLNHDERGASLPVAIRVYQLKDDKAFNAATYTQLLSPADSVLKSDVVNQTDIVLGPKMTVTLNKPMADDAHYVCIVGFFRDPSGTGWKQVIPKSQWKHTDPVRISVIGNRIQMEH